jgi:hypothetical protein
MSTWRVENLPSHWDKRFGCDVMSAGAAQIMP